MLKAQEFSKNLLIFAIILVSFVFIEAQKAQKDTEDRIVGGVRTTIAKEPYIVQLLRDGAHICGGSILSAFWILTAAHCVHGYVSQAARFEVRGGATFLSGNAGVTRQVAKMVLPASYNPDTYNMDMAMLKLTKALKGPNIKPIPLATKMPPNGVLVKTSGWGFTSEDGTGSNQLQTVQTSKIARDACRKRYAARNTTITNNMICAASPGKDSCSGDSGGPLTYDNKLVGVVSFGIGCARKGFPGVYTSIMSIKGFIKQVRQNN